MQRCTATQVWNDGLGIELGFNFQQLLLFLWKAMLSTSQEGETRREVEPNCVLHLFLGLLLEMRQSPIGQFFSLSLVTESQKS